jgi:hypothetical protein
MEGYSRNWSCGTYLMKVIPKTGHVEHTWWIWYRHLLFFILLFLIHTQ